MKFYRLADYHPNQKTTARAINTHIRRPPKKGEWYLSGAIPAAYKAPNDLSTEYLIAEIVDTEVIRRIKD